MFGGADPGAGDARNRAEPSGRACLGCGHWTQERPAEVTALLLDWLKGALGPKGSSTSLLPWCRAGSHSKPRKIVEGGVEMARHGEPIRRADRAPMLLPGVRAWG